MGLLPIAVGLGMATSLLMTEAFGLATGGLVVPGYVALLIDKPWELGMLLLAAAITYLIVRMISIVAIVYGRRRTTLTLLVGYLAHIGVRFALLDFLPSDIAETLHAGEALGLIVPGLLALWLTRQGLLETLSALCCAASITRLAMILVAGERLVP